MENVQIRRKLRKYIKFKQKLPDHFYVGVVEKIYIEILSLRF